MQMTQDFIRLDGTPDRATIRVSRRRDGFSASIQIGRIRKTVTAIHPLADDAFGVALRALLNHRDNAIV